MKLEGVGEQDFYNQISSYPAENKPNYLASISSFISLSRTVLDYGAFYLNSPEHLKPFLATGIPMLVSLWAYERISGRGISKLSSEGLLAPAVILYKTATTQDDIFDALSLAHQDVRAKESFWYRPQLPGDILPKDGFKQVIKLITDNKQLSPSSRTRILREIAATYRSYVLAEDELKDMARKGDLDLYQSYLLKARSYSAMAVAITSILNGNNHLSEIEEKMAWFSIMTDIIDGEMDIEEDFGNTVSVPIASSIYDSHLGNKDGETKERILAWYLNQTGNVEVNNLMLVGRNLRPKIDVVFSKLQTLRGKGPVCSFIIRRQTPSY